MAAEKRLLPAEIEDLIYRVLVAHRTGDQNARSVAKALAAAEVDGRKGHGLSRLAAYAGQARSGKVDGYAVPAIVRPKPGVLRIDAGYGFAFPAMDAAIEALPGVVEEVGVAFAGIFRSHHAGVIGHVAERLAERGLVALVLANSPKAIAPWGGSQGLYGTNPIAFAAPRSGGVEPLLIDLALSRIARGKIMVAAQKGQAIPEGWALDPDGNATTDAKAALEGTMLPIGDAKGAALAMMVEILSATLVGAHMGFEASSFFTADGPPPGVGQCIIAIDPGMTSGDIFAERLEILMSAITDQPGTRLPGSRRIAVREAATRDGVVVDADQVAALETMAG